MVYIVVLPFTALVFLVVSCSVVGVIIRHHPFHDVRVFFIDGFYVEMFKDVLLSEF